MDNNQKAKKEYLIKMFNNIQGEDIGLEEYEAVRWYELRGYSTDEASQLVLDKYRKVMLNDSYIVDTIIRFDETYIVVEYDEFKFLDEDEKDIKEREKKFKEYVGYLSDRFCGYEFTVENNCLKDDPNGYIKEMYEAFIANEIIQSLVRQREYKESQIRLYERISNKVETKIDRLGRDVTQYGFFDIPKIKELSEDSKLEITELIAEHSTPYAIAMFEYIGFIKHLCVNHFKTKESLFKEIAKWFGVHAREVKGNIAVLNEKSKEDSSRYTACEYRDAVQRDFDKLKNGAK